MLSDSLNQEFIDKVVKTIMDTTSMGIQSKNQTDLVNAINSIDAKINIVEQHLTFVKIKMTEAINETTQVKNELTEVKNKILKGMTKTAQVKNESTKVKKEVNSAPMQVKNELTEVKNEIQEVKTESAQVKNDIILDIKEVKSKTRQVKTEIETKEVKDGIKALKNEMIEVKNEITKVNNILNTEFEAKKKHQMFEVALSSVDPTSFYYYVRRDIEVVSSDLAKSIITWFRLGYGYNLSKESYISKSPIYTDEGFYTSKEEEKKKKALLELEEGKKAFHTALLEQLTQLLGKKPRLVNEGGENFSVFYS